MNRFHSSFPCLAGLRRARAAGALLAVLLLATGVAALEEPKVPKPPFVPSNECEQNCFDDYLGNVERCRGIFCTHFLFFTLWCDEPGLDACTDNADAVFDACIANCQDPNA